MSGAAVVIVNFNSARLAVDAALSVLGDDAGARVIIVDNFSTDESREYFRALEAGRTQHYATAPENAEPAPVFARWRPDLLQITEDGRARLADAPITVFFASENRGFAAGCNIAVRALMNASAPDIFLFLNPDALLAKGALAAFRQRLTDPCAGLCGASVLRFASPHEAQAFGGARLRPGSLLGENIGAGLCLNDAPSVAEAEARLSYPLGAAMACRRDYIETAGLPDERFFLFYEEADWAEAGRPYFAPAWAKDAVVYHRHGAAAGSRLESGGRSPHADFHMARSRMLFALKRRPALVPFLVAGALVQALRRASRGHWARAGAVIAGCALVSRPRPSSAVR